MDSNTIIKKVINFDCPERIGFDFNPPHISDFVYGSYDSVLLEGCMGWKAAGHFQEEFPELRDFTGEARRDEFGNIWGRVSGDSSKGEIIAGALKDWNDLKSFKMPSLNMDLHFKSITGTFEKEKDKYKVATFPFTFVIMRDLRRLENFLCDVILSRNDVLRLNEIVMEWVLILVKTYGSVGADAIMFFEDWGTQDRLMISPVLWKELFKPSYTALCETAHDLGMHVIMHSCGYIYEIINELVEVGIDVLQLDQPMLMGIDRLAGEFGGRITFFSPVDIQKVMSTGSRELIETAAGEMIEKFGRRKGGFIAKDYSDYKSINVKEEWANWAREVFLKHSY